jgi:hypothetical protein
VLGLELQPLDEINGWPIPFGLLIQKERCCRCSARDAAHRNRSLDQATLDDLSPRHAGINSGRRV